MIELCNNLNYCLFVCLFAAKYLSVMAAILARRALASIVGVSGITSITSVNQNMCSFCTTLDNRNISVGADCEMKVKLTESLPGPDVASKLNVHRFKTLVSKEEIEEILEFESKHRFSLGSTRRDNIGIRKLNSEWVTTYLHTDQLFQRQFPALMRRLINAAYEADRLEHWNLIHRQDGATVPESTSESEVCSEDEKKRHVGVRVIELHRVSRDGGLCDIRHHDTGSIMTVDLMLADSLTDFTGGQFSTAKFDDTSESASVQTHEFQQGDVVVFPSHKYHFVRPVTSGQRMVLVMELWFGRDRACAHRCLTPSYLPCSFTVTQSVCENLLKAATPDIDPW